MVLTVSLFQLHQRFTSMILEPVLHPPALTLTDNSASFFSTFLTSLSSLWAALLLFLPSLPSSFSLPGWLQSAVGLERRRALQVPSSVHPLSSSSTLYPLLPQHRAASLLTQVTPPLFSSSNSSSSSSLSWGFTVALGDTTIKYFLNRQILCPLLTLSTE